MILIFDMPFFFMAIDAYNIIPVFSMTFIKSTKFFMKQLHLTILKWTVKLKRKQLEPLPSQLFKSLIRYCILPVSELLLIVCCVPNDIPFFEVTFLLILLLNKSLLTTLAVATHILIVFFSILM